MKYYLTKLAVSLGVAATAFGQQINLGGNQVTGVLTAPKGGSGTTPGTSLPVAPCTNGKTFVKTNASPASTAIYACVGTAWVLQSGGGSNFTGSTATSSTGITGTAANPIFSLSDQSVKSPMRFETAALAANVASVTINNKTPGAKFSIVWTQNGAGAWTVTYGASASRTCPIALTGNAVTTQQFEVAADGTTVYGTGCTSTDDGTFIPGSTSGGTSLISPATGTQTVTLPGASTTLMGKDTTDTMLGKTFDTAGAGNVLRINGTGVTAVNGTGAVCLATGNTCSAAFSGVAAGTNANALHIGTGGSLDATGSGTIVATSTNGQGPLVGTAIGATAQCVSAASPAVCTTRIAGYVVIAAAATSVVVNTSAMTAVSQVALTFDSSAGAILGVTCNTTFAAPWITARSAGVSFTVTVGAAPATNPACYSFLLTN